MTVPAGTTIAVGDDADLDLTDAAAVEVTGGPVLASLTMAGHAGDGNLIGVLPLTPDADQEQSVQVRLGAY